MSIPTNRQVHRMDTASSASPDRDEGSSSSWNRKRPRHGSFDGDHDLPPSPTPSPRHLPLLAASSSSSPASSKVTPPDRYASEMFPMSPASPRHYYERDEIGAADDEDERESTDLVDCDLSLCRLTDDSGKAVVASSNDNPMITDHNESPTHDSDGFPVIPMFDQLFNFEVPLTPPADPYVADDDPIDLELFKTLTRPVDSARQLDTARSSMSASRGGYVFGGRVGTRPLVFPGSGRADSSLASCGRSRRGGTTSALGTAGQAGPSSDPHGPSFSSVFASRLTLDSSTSVASTTGPYTRQNSRQRSVRKEKWDLGVFTGALDPEFAFPPPSVRAALKLASRTKSSSVSKPSPQSHSHSVLPNEIWTHVLSFLDARMLSLVSTTNRRFAFLGSDQLLWLSLCMAHSVPTTSLPHIHKDAIFDSTQPTPIHIPGQWTPRLDPADRNDPGSESTVWSWRRAFAVQARARTKCLTSRVRFTRITKAHREGITSLATIDTGPTPTVVTGGRDGLIKVWKVVSRQFDPQQMEVEYDERQRWFTWGGVILDDELSVAEQLAGGGGGGGDPTFIDLSGGNDIEDEDDVSSRSGTGSFDLELTFAITCSGRVESIAVHEGLLIAAVRSGRLGHGVVSIYRLSNGSHVRTVPLPGAINLGVITTDGETVTVTSKELGVQTIPQLPRLCSVSQVQPQPAEHVIIPNDGFEVTTAHILRPHVTVSGDSRGLLKVHDTSNGQLLAALQAPPGLLASTVHAVAPDRYSLLCGFKDGFLRRYRIVLGETSTTTSTTVEPANESTLTSLSDWITCVSEEPLCGLVFGGSWDGRVRIWDTRKRLGGGEEGGRLRRTLCCDVRSAVLSVGCVDVDGGKALVAGCYDGGLVIWDFGSVPN